MIVRSREIRYNPIMFRSKPCGERPKVTGKEVAATAGLSYGLAIALSNLALAATTHAYIDTTRDIARTDELSQETSQIATKLAGYAVDVGCTDTIFPDEDNSEDGTTTLGGVVRYRAVDPLLIRHDVPINPRAVRLKPAVCHALVGPRDYLTPLEVRQDAAMAYSMVLHELIHLEYPSYDETMTQCAAIDSMPDRLATVGIDRHQREWAAEYVEQAAERFQPARYHEYPCPE